MDHDNDMVVGKSAIQVVSENILLNSNDENSKMSEDSLEFRSENANKKQTIQIDDIQQQSNNDDLIYNEHSDDDLGLESIPIKLETLSACSNIELESIASSSDSDSTDEEDYSTKANGIPGSMISEIDFDDNMHDSTALPRTKHEIDALPPIAPIVYEVPSDAILNLVGHVFSTVDESVVVRATEHQHTLDSGSLLFYDDRSVLGEVFETFGPIKEPYYYVRISPDDKNRALIGRGVYFILEKGVLINANSLKTSKGSDASNWFDEEIGEDELEFSDDEKETAHRRSVKERRKQVKSRVSNPENQSKVAEKKYYGEDYEPLQRPQLLPQNETDQISKLK